MGVFITFEGGEGSGKSFQSKALYRKLNNAAVPAVLTHEPGGTVVGDKLARLLKFAHSAGISPITELLLFNASRSQLVDTVITPALQAGKVVICDRYTDSTVAYQHYGRGLDFKLVNSINYTATGGLIPTLTFLCDVPVKVGLARKGYQKPDRFEIEQVAFHRKVRRGYLRMALNEPQRWVVINACQSKKKIAQFIWQEVSACLKSKA